MPRVYRDTVPCFDAEKLRAQRPAAPDQYGSAAPRRQRPKETLPVGRAVGAPARFRAGSRRGQSRLHKKQ